jgi:hypothetical protein
MHPQQSSSAKWRLKLETQAMINALNSTEAGTSRKDGQLQNCRGEKVRVHCRVERGGFSTVAEVKIRFPHRKSGAKIKAFNPSYRGSENARTLNSVIKYPTTVQLRF